MGERRFRPDIPRCDTTWSDSKMVNVDLIAESNRTTQIIRFTIVDTGDLSLGQVLRVGRTRTLGPDHQKIELVEVCHSNEPNWNSSYNFSENVNIKMPLFMRIDTCNYRMQNTTLKHKETIFLSRV